MNTRYLLVALLVCASISRATAEDKKPDPKPREIDKATTEAWEKRGFRIGWAEQHDNNSWVRIDHRRNANSTLPVVWYNGPMPPTDEILKDLPQVEVPFAFVLVANELTEVGLKRLAGLNNLAILCLSNISVTDDALKHLTEFKNLTSLHLSYSTMTESGLKKLAALKNLTTLDLLGAKNVTDEVLKNLAELKNLTRLNIGQTQVTDAGLEHVARLTNLTTLGLFDTRVTDNGLKHLSGLKNLTALDLKLDPKSTEITSAGLKHLSGLKNLTTLHVSITDKTIRALSEAGLLHCLPQAETADGKRPSKAEDVDSLNLSGTQLGDNGLKYIAELKNLKYLNLLGVKVTDNDLVHLAKLKELIQLNLGSTQITGAGLKYLVGLKNLSELHVEITDEVLQTLSEAGLLHCLSDAKAAGGKRPTRAEDVVEFHLRNAHITDEGLKYLAGLKNLAGLNLYATRISGAGLKYLAGLNNLTWIFLCDTALTDEGVKRLAAIKNLKSIDLNDTNITAAELNRLSALKNLTALRLDITDEVFEALYEADLITRLPGAKAEGGKRPTKAEDIVSLDLSFARLDSNGLKYAAKLKNLTHLNLKHAVVNDAWLQDLQRTLPNCKITK